MKQSVDLNDLLKQVVQEVTDEDVAQAQRSVAEIKKAQAAPRPLRMIAVNTKTGQ